MYSRFLNLFKIVFKPNNFMFLFKWICRLMKDIIKNRILYIYYCVNQWRRIHGLGRAAAWLNFGVGGSYGDHIEDLRIVIQFS